MSARGGTRTQRRPGVDASSRRPAQPAIQHPRPWLHPAIIAFVFVALAAWTWLSWTDPVVDFGRELYVPWRITEGDRLYRDLAYFNGPLSPYLNAGFFTVFGVSLRTLVWANLIVLAAVVVLLWALLREVASELGATIGVIAFLACCAFGQMVYVGNYDWVTPYSHEVTHGIALGLASLWALARWRDSGSTRWLAAAGMAAGLTFLTKPEVFVATGAAGALGVALQGRRSRDLARSAAVWAGALVAPACLATLLLSVGIGLHDAVHGVLRAYAALGDPAITRNPFYVAVAGLDQPGASLGLIALYPLAACALCLPAGLLAWLGRGWPRELAAVVAIVVTAVTAKLAVPLPYWADVGRVLPVALLVIAVAALPAFAPKRADRLDATLVLCSFALLLLAKVALDPEIRHYGFALGAAAWALTVAMLAGPLPDWIQTRWSAGTSARAAALTLIAAPVLMFLVQTWFFLDAKRVVVGTSNDAFHANERGAVVNQAVRWLDDHRGPGMRPLAVAALPQGVMLNYLARVANPTPYFTLMPIETALFGEDAMLRAYEQHPPDVILLVHSDTREYGARWFGIDYAPSFKTWIGAHYQTAAIYGDPPLREGSQFGIAVLERTDESDSGRTGTTAPMGG